MSQYIVEICTTPSILRLVSTETTMEELYRHNIPALMEAAMEKSWCPPVGLAAIQVGAPLRFAMHFVHEDAKAKEGYVTKFDAPPKLLLNPIIEQVYNLQPFPQEGCLSIPDQRFNTWRYTGLVYTNEEEGKRVRHTVNGFEAVVIQHEIDHLNGFLCYDRCIKPRAPRRNERCTCGSGKKYKQCCENNPIKTIESPNR